MNKYEDNLIIELINKDKAINALIPIMCKHSIEPVIQNEIILCLLNIKEDIEEEVKSIFEKATSKKPIEQRTWTYDEIPYTILCPNCKENLGYEAKRLYKHCPTCGQALDWSGEDE